MFHEQFFTIDAIDTSTRFSHGSKIQDIIIHKYQQEGSAALI